MPYSEKVIDHYNNPRNVGTLDKSDPRVGTGIVGAPECGDVMKLQIKVVAAARCGACNHEWEIGSDSEPQSTKCPRCFVSDGVTTFKKIIDAKFKTFGCGSAIASSSLATEWLKGKTLQEAQTIKNTDIVKELALPPVKIHCSVLAEDAIKAALADYEKKEEGEGRKTP